MAVATMGERAPEALGGLVGLRGVGKAFRSEEVVVHALREVDLEVREGEFLALTGASGSGKSTLLGVLGGITPPDHGVVEIDGIDVYSLGTERLADFRREFVGFVFQQFHLVPYLTAAENVMLPLCASRRPVGERRERAAEVLRRVGLAGKLRRLPSQLSGGEQQRVAIARALVNEPPLLLTDEPTGNLDTRTGEEIFALFRELNGAGETIVMVTHDPGLASRADRVVRMRDGRVVP